MFSHSSVFKYWRDITSGVCKFLNVTFTIFSSFRILSWNWWSILPLKKVLPPNKAFKRVVYLIWDDSHVIKNFHNKILNRSIDMKPLMVRRNHLKHMMCFIKKEDIDTRYRWFGISDAWNVVQWFQWISVWFWSLSKFRVMLDMVHR